MALKFRTEVAVRPVDTKITYGSRIVTIGSCFSDEVGARLRNRMFDVSVNPVGTLYNPMSIAMALESLMSERIYTEADLVNRDGLWHIFDHHSRFSAQDPSRCLSQINIAMKEGRDALAACTHLFVTFGTSWVYTRDGSVVANCHKFPACEFHRTCMRVDEIVDIWLSLLDRLHRFNPAMNVIFTISPIRHMSDGAHGNQLSKATLLLAVESIMELTDMAVEYFPAYELVLDDLRDYRFYDSDLTHPSDMAVDYVYGKLADMFFDPKTVKASCEAEKLLRFAHHRPMSCGSEGILHHESQLKKKIESLLTAYPDMTNAVNKLFHRI